jgi:metal-dependent amidase/aminoacylase/carboxypeptidase family protein
VIHDGLRRSAEGAAATYGCQCTVHIDETYNITVNDAHEASRVRRQSESITTFIEMPTPVMASEDFSFVLGAVPGAMAFLGMCPEDIADFTAAPPAHSPQMRLSEEPMALGAALHALMAMARS